MNAQSNDGIKHANRVIDQDLESLLGNIREIRAGLDRLEAEATAIETDGYDANQFRTAVGGRSMNVDAAKYAELDAYVRTINDLRTVVALSDAS